MENSKDLEDYEGTRYSKTLKESYVKEVREAFEENGMKLISLTQQVPPREETGGTIEALVYSEDGDLGKKNTGRIMSAYKIDSVRMKR